MAGDRNPAGLLGECQPHPGRAGKAKAQERGYCMHPQLFGAPAERNVLFAVYPHMMGKANATP
jgi:hypothetical protein